MMWYIEWRKGPENDQNSAMGRFAVYFRTRLSAELAMMGWLLDNKVTYFDIKEV